MGGSGYIFGGLFLQVASLRSATRRNIFCKNERKRSFLPFSVGGLSLPVDGGVLIDFLSCRQTPARSPIYWFRQFVGRHAMKSKEPERANKRPDLLFTIGRVSLPLDGSVLAHFLGAGQFVEVREQKSNGQGWA